MSSEPTPLKITSPPSLARSGITSSRKTLTQIFDHKEGFHFWNNTLGSFMNRGVVNPILSATKGGKFRINCLESDSYIREAERSEEIVPLRVSIQVIRADGTGDGHLSCRTRSSVTGSSFAEYRNNVGVKETFEMVHSRADNSYLFKSYNHLYLHCNQTFHTVGFKTCSERSRCDGLPIKGRWGILGDDGESDRTGKYSGSVNIVKDLAFAPVKILKCRHKTV